MGEVARTISLGHFAKSWCNRLRVRRGLLRAWFQLGIRRTVGPLRQAKPAAWQSGRVLGVAVMTITLSTAAFSEPKASGAKPKGSTKAVESPQPRKPLPELASKGTLAAQYCEAIRDAAVDARNAAQMDKLEKLGQEIDRKMARLEARRDELKQWLAKRDEFTRRATEQLVGIFAGMRPESASEQLASLEPATAAAILMKLEARSASAILNDMPAEKAAGLTSILLGAAKRDPVEAGRGR